MADPFGGFLTFLVALYAHISTLISGCVVTFVIGFIEKRILRRSISLKTEIGILIAFLFFACFQTWRDQFDARRNAEQQVNQGGPNLIGEIEEYFIGYNPQLHRTQAIILVSVRNLGDPSIAQGWQLKVHTASREFTASPTMIPSEMKIYENGKTYAFHGRDALYEKAIKPIERGSLVRGWLWYEFPRISLEEVNRKNSTWTIDFEDVLRKHHAIVGKPGLQAEHWMYYPGSENPTLELRPK